MKKCLLKIKVDGLSLNGKEYLLDFSTMDELTSFITSLGIINHFVKKHDDPYQLDDLTNLLIEQSEYDLGDKYLRKDMNDLIEANGFDGEYLWDEVRDYLSNRFFIIIDFEYGSIFRKSTQFATNQKIASGGGKH